MIRPTVSLVDDDAHLRRSLQWMLTHTPWRVQAYDSATRFFDEFDPQAPGCVLLDVIMPGLGGLEVQQRLASRNWPTPVIMLSGCADVPMAVRAMEAGAFAFLEKPVACERLLERITSAIERDRVQRLESAERDKARSALARLTRREREVLELVVDGLTSDQISDELCRSPKTIQLHRAHIMKKMEAPNLPSLVRQVMIAQVDGQQAASLTT